MIKFLLDNRLGFFMAGLLFAAFGAWMLVDPGLLADQSGGRLSVNRKVLAAIWGPLAGGILVLAGVANIAAGVLRGGDLNPPAGS